jgi:hypothetical protein
MSKQLTPQQIRQIRAALTWGDNHYARKEAGKDADTTDVLAYSMHRAARRLKVIPADESLEDFLDSLSMETLAEGLKDEEGAEDPIESGKA